MITKKLTIFTTFLILTNFAWAQVELLSSATRPKISEVKKFHAAGKRSQATLVSGGRFNLKFFRDSLEQGAPQFIAKLEKAYPNGTFVFMGRDTQLIADMVDAFYESIGQKGRVVQLGVSKPTLVGMDADSIMSYLEYYDIKLDSLSEKSPTILVDTISSGEVIGGSLISGRQGRFILQTVYKKWMDNGKNPTELLNRFNMIGMQVSTFQDGDPSNAKRYRRIDRLQEATLANSNFLTSPGIDKNAIGNNFVIPLISDTRELFNEAGYDHFTATWHDKYQSPKLVDGKLLPNPGSLMPKEYRDSVLWIQHEIIDIVDMPSFKDRVLEEARKLGVVFKLQDAVTAKVEKIGPAVNLDVEYRNRIKLLFANLSPLGKEKDYNKIKANNATVRLTNNGSDVLASMANQQSVDAPRFFEISLMALIELYESDRIGARDFRRILTVLIGLKPIEGSDFFKMAKANYKKVLPLEIMLGRDAEREKLLNQGGITGKNYRLLIENGNLKMSCQFAYGA